MPRPPVPDAIVPELFERIDKFVKSGDVVYTLAHHRPNTITDVSMEGVHVETDRSRKAGSGTHLVPGWMFNYAWQELQRTGQLTNDRLISIAKRSSAVCAILARLPDVDVVSTQPITLNMTSSSTRP